MNAIKDWSQPARIALSSITLALILALALPAAHAWANFGGETGDQGGGGSGPQQPGTGTGTPGGGGNAGKPAYYYRTIINSVSYAKQFCAAKDNRGQNLVARKASYRYPSTMNWAQAEREIALGINNYSRMGITETATCIYPPAYRDRQIRVVLDSQVTITRVRPTSATLADVRMTSRWQKGEHTVAGARASNKLHAAAHINLAEYGQYQAIGKTRSRYVTVREWLSRTDGVGNTYSDQVISIGPVFNAHHTLARAQVDCTGMRERWSDSSFTHTECGPTQTKNPPIYQCRADSGPAVTVNGQSTRNVTLPRSGEAVPVTFAAVRPTGLTNVGAERTRWTRSGTPWRTNGVSVRDAMVKLSVKPGGAQLFTSDKASAWNSGVITNLNLSANWASDEGKPTVIKPSYSYQGTATVRSVIITGISETGWTTRTINRNIRALAVCDGTPLTASFVRSVQGAG